MVKCLEGLGKSVNDLNLEPPKYEQECKPVNHNIQCYVVKELVYNKKVSRQCKLQISMKHINKLLMYWCNAHWGFIGKQRKFFRDTQNWLQVSYTYSRAQWADFDTFNSEFVLRGDFMVSDAASNS
jgi:hypothetical protein